MAAPSPAVAGSASEITTSVEFLPGAFLPLYRTDGALLYSSERGRSIPLAAGETAVQLPGRELVRLAVRQETVSDATFALATVLILAGAVVLGWERQLHLALIALAVWLCFVWDVFARAASADPVLVHRCAWLVRRRRIFLPDAFYVVLPRSEEGNRTTRVWRFPLRCPAYHAPRGRPISSHPELRPTTVALRESVTQGPVLRLEGPAGTLPLTDPFPPEELAADTPDLRRRIEELRELGKLFAEHLGLEFDRGAYPRA